MPKGNPDYVAINKNLELPVDDYVIMMAAKGAFMCQCIIEAIDDYKEIYTLKLINFKIYQDPKKIKTGFHEFKYFTKEDADVKIQKNKIIHDWIFNQIQSNIKICKKEDLIKVELHKKIELNSLDWANIVLAVEQKYGQNELHKKIVEHIDNNNLY
jgi:acyl carrier protein